MFFYFVCSKMKISDFQEVIVMKEEWIQEAVKMRRTLHRYPELSEQEFKTTAYIQEKLTEWGISYRPLKTPTGVVAEIGTKEGTVIALRADMDALPIHEQTDLDYRSEHDGVMHACGHDFHTASLLMAAKILKEKEESLNGKIRFIFQPAEEMNRGARALIAEGVLEGVDAIIGFHNKPELPVGTIGIKSGPLMAAVGQFSVELKGVGTHAAAPHNGNDPIVTACQIITNLQAIVSRHVSPLSPAVLSISHIEGGNTWNVIPERVFFEGTIRTFYKKDQEKIRSLMEHMVRQMAVVYGQEAHMEWIMTPPVVDNDEEVTNIVKETTEQFATVVTPELTLGAEDFANYMEYVPGCFAFIGTGCPYEWHHPSFLVDDAALQYAISYFVENSQALLNQYQKG